MPSCEFSCAGPNAVLMSLSAQPSEPLLNRIFALQQYVEKQRPAWLLDIVPAFVTVLVVFDAASIERFTVQRWLQQAWRSSLDEPIKAPVQHTVPVYYNADLCPDLDVVAAMKGMTIEDVITLHSAHVYRVYALGFAPGFAYLGELDEQLRVPRLASPRKSIPAGSVAIAETQTAIYPLSSPAGWHVLGLSPMVLHPSFGNMQPRFNVGDEIRFESISRENFEDLGGVIEVVQ